MAKFELPDYGQHLVLLGSTGCGKSTAAEFMLQYYSNYLAIDTQDSLELDGMKVTNPGFMKGYLKLFKRINYVPKDDFKTRNSFNSLFQTVVDSSSKKKPRPRVLYIDEIYHIGYGASFPNWLPRSITTARQRKISFWISTQRPKQIPQPVLSEASRILVFRLSKEDDIKYAASFARSGTKELYRVLQEQQDDFSFIEINTRKGTWEKKPALIIK